MSDRREAFQYLLADREVAREAPKDLSKSEFETLMALADISCDDHWRFWAIAAIVQGLSDWGVTTSVWLHERKCGSHETQKAKEACRLKGRCGIQLASGAWKCHMNALNNLKLPPKAVLLMDQLRERGLQHVASNLFAAFEDCKRQMVLRCMQAWSFWDNLPHAVLGLARHLVDPECSEDDCRSDARKFLSQYDACASKSALGIVTWAFLGRLSSRKALEDWAVRKRAMDLGLRRMLLGYGGALIVMQRLEGRHHLVHQSMSRGRAQTPAAVIAGLRRHHNPDVRMDAFREQLQDLMQRTGELVSQPWNSRRQLLDIVYGSGLDSMHPDTEADDQTLARHAANLASISVENPRLVAWPIVANACGCL